MMWLIFIVKRAYLLGTHKQLHHSLVLNSYSCSRELVLVPMACMLQCCMCMRIFQRAEIIQVFLDLSQPVFHIVIKSIRLLLFCQNFLFFMHFYHVAVESS